MHRAGVNMPVRAGGKILGLNQSIKREWELEFGEQANETNIEITLALNKIQNILINGIDRLEQREREA